MPPQPPVDAPPHVCIWPPTLTPGVVWKHGFFLITLRPYRFFSSLSFHIGPTSFAPNIIVFRSGPLKGWIVLASLFRVVSIWVFWSSHQCNTLACADAGPICQIKPINHVCIFCRWVGKMTVVKLEWRLLGFAWICWDFFFYSVDCCLADCPEKMIFGSGKSFLIVGECRLLGFAGTGKLPGKKWFLGWENHFVKAGICCCFFFAVSILLLARLPGKERGGSGICWDFFFCGVYCCLAECRGKKWFLGGENDFSEIGD